MQTLTFNEIQHEASDLLDGFEIFKKPSSNVAFYGLKGSTLFVQFMAGSCYVYELSSELAAQVNTAESIGKFVANQVVNKAPSQKIEPNQVKSLARVTVLLKMDIFSGKHKQYGKAHEEVYLVTDAVDVCIVENMKTADRYPVSTGNILRKAA